MAPVIWGLDLAEFKWSHFKSSYMFGNTDYHLRRTKFVVYQLAMIFCVVSESLGTAALTDYVSQQDNISRANHFAGEYYNDYIAIASFNIFFGIFNAFIFGAAFFFDLQWPERKEIPAVRIAWRVTSVLACFIGFADLIAMTVIVSSCQAYITGVPAEEGQQLLSVVGGYNPVYRRNGRAVASLVFLWLGYPFVVCSMIVLFKSLDYIETNGPFSHHVLEAKSSPGSLEAQADGSNDRNSHELQEMHRSASSAAVSQAATGYDDNDDNDDDNDDEDDEHKEDTDCKDAAVGAGDGTMDRVPATLARMPRLPGLSTGRGGRTAVPEGFSPPMDSGSGGTYRGT